MNTHPIFGHVISGMMEAQRLQAPGMEPPLPMGCPSCAAAEAQCDRMAQQIRKLEAALAFRDADVAALNLEIKRLNDLSEWWHSRVEHLLGYLSEIRVACGDGGKREGQELVDYLRILYEEADPDRVSQREAA